MKKLTRKRRERIIKINLMLRKKVLHNKKEKTRYSVDAPKIIDIRDKNNRKHFLHFISKLFLRRKVKGALRICFEKTKHITPEAMILFLAKLKLARSISRSYLDIKVVPPTDVDCEDAEKIRQVLHKVGVYEITGQSIKARCVHPMVTSWSVLKGNTSDPFDAAAVKDFLEIYDQQVDSALHKAFKEALINIGHHAFKRGKHGNWIAFVHINQDIRTVVVCDLGMGIPVSISQGSDDIQRELFNLVERLVNSVKRNPRDSDYIRGSIKYGISVTGKKGRGKGLAQMKQVVDSLENGKSKLNIYSNKGLYNVSSGDASASLEDYSGSIGGTIITWSVPVSAN